MSEPKYVSNESAQRTTRAIVVVFFALWLAGAYWLWPSGITDTALGAIKLGELLRAVGAAVMVVVGTISFILLWME